MNIRPSIYVFFTSKSTTLFAGLDYTQLSVSAFFWNTLTPRSGDTNGQATKIGTSVFIIAGRTFAYLNMADFLNTGIWVREFVSPTNGIRGVDYMLNTDYFLQNGLGVTTVQLYLDTSTAVQDTVNTASANAREIKHIPETDAFAVVN
jgi:hypothetical protein